MENPAFEFLRAQVAAQTTASNVERAAAQAEREAERAASAAKFAALEDAASRTTILVALSSLISRCRNTADGAAMEAAPESSPSASNPRWNADSALFSTLCAKVECASELAIDMSAAIFAAKCTEAAPGCPERPSRTHPSADSVHAHVQPVVDAVGRTLKCGKWTLSGTAEDQPGNVEILRERSYNDLVNSHIPDFSAALGRGDRAPAHLTAESQVGIVECKKCMQAYASLSPGVTAHALSTLSPCVGEIQTAGYVAQSLYPAIAAGADLAALSLRPLSAYGIYTDSKTSTLVEVRITGATVEVFFSRMPFLPAAVLPEGTAGVDANSNACGAVAFGLGVMATLGESRLRASAAAVYIQSISPPPEGTALPAIAPFLGRGKFARVFRLYDIAVKIPLSSLTPAASWTEAIGKEALALARLADCRPRCRHFPELVHPVLACEDRDAHGTSLLVASPFPVKRQIAGASSILLRVVAEGSIAAGAATAESTRHVQGLLTMPVCTMLPAAVSDLRQRIPLAERTIPMLQFWSLAIALPLMAAQAYARSVGLSHFDAHVMNVAMFRWNPVAAEALLRNATAPAAVDPRPASYATASLGALLSADSPVSSSRVTLCGYVILNDWGSSRATGNSALSKKHAVAVDTGQVIALVGQVLLHMLDFQSADELGDTASADIAEWWRETYPRLKKFSSELQQVRAELLEGTAPQLHLLRALGFASEAAAGGSAAGGPATRASFKRSRVAADASTSLDARSTTDPSATDEDGARGIAALCCAAVAASGCSCYATGFTLAPFATESTEEGDDEVHAVDVKVCDLPDSVAARGCADAASGAVVEQAAQMPASAEVVPAAPVDSDVAILITNVAGFFNEDSLQAVMAHFGEVCACVLLPPDLVAPLGGRRALVQYADAAVAARVVAGLTAFEIGGCLLQVAAAPAALVARYLH